MCRTSARILIGLVVLAVPLTAQQRLQDVRLSYLCADNNLPAIAAAWKDLLFEHPDLRGRVELTLLTESLFDEVDPRSFVDADALVLSVHDQHTIERFNATHGIDLIGQAVRRGTVFGVGEGLLGRDHYEPLGVTWDRRARAYWEYSGFANQLELLKYVLSAAGVDGLAPGEPQPNLEAGYYYPGDPRGRVFATWQEFDDWRARAGGKRPGAPRIAVGFYGADFDSGNTGLVDAVVAEIERQGAEAVPVFGYPAGLAFETLLLDDSGEARVDVAMAFLFRFAGPDAGSSLARLDVPVLSLISLYGRGEQEWRESEMGLSLFEGTFQVVSPELAGLVAPTVVGSQEQIADPDTGLTIVARRPIPSRVAMAVRRALRYAALATTPNAGKRLALLYYNYPPGKADIGASYLNVAESLANVLERLRRRGLRPWRRRDRPLRRCAAGEDARRRPERGELRAGRARPDARRRRCRPYRHGRVPPLAGRTRPGTPGEDGGGLGAAGSGGSHGCRTAHPRRRAGTRGARHSLRQRRPAAAAGAGLGRGSDPALPRRRPGAAPPVRGRLPVAARAGGRRRLSAPTPSFTSVRTARWSGSTARRWA